MRVIRRGRQVCVTSFLDTRYRTGVALVSPEPAAMYLKGLFVTGTPGYGTAWLEVPSCCNRLK
jgi:hypothetical protein